MTLLITHSYPPASLARLPELLPRLPTTTLQSRLPYAGLPFPPIFLGISKTRERVATLMNSSGARLNTTTMNSVDVAPPQLGEGKVLSDPPPIYVKPQVGQKPACSHGLPFNMSLVGATREQSRCFIILRNNYQDNYVLIPTQFPSQDDVKKK